VNILRKKVAAIILMVILVSTVFSGCSKTQTPMANQGGKSASPTGSALSDSSLKNTTSKDFSYPMEPITLSINIDPLTDADFPAWAGDYVFWTRLEEETGVKLEFIGSESNANEPSEKFLLLLASGDYPDLFLCNWLDFPGGPNAAINDGYIIPLNDYTEYFPSLMSCLEKDPELNKMIRTDEGTLYCFPFIGEKEMNGNTGAIIRQDWLDELNLDVPVTIDDWYNVLKAFKKEKNVPAPLTFEARWLFLQYAASLLSSPWEVCYPFYLVDGQVKFGPLEPGYKDFLAEMSKWYAEGLIDRDLPSVDKKTVEAKFASGEAGISIQQTTNIVNTLKATANDPKFKITGLTTPVMNRGDEPQFNHHLNLYQGCYCMSISTQCKNIEAACRFADYFYTQEGHMLTSYGTEGFSYEIVNGEVQFTDVIMNNPEAVPATARYVVSYFNNWPIIASGYTKHLTPDIIEIRSKFLANMDKYAIPPITHTSDESEYISVHYNNIDTYCREMIIKYILGDESLDTYDKFIETIKGFGIDKILEYKQAAYERYLKR